jgi:monoamine oxidase
MGYVGMLELPLLEIKEAPTDLVVWLRGTRIGQPGAANAAWPVSLSAPEQQEGYFGLWAQYVLPTVHNSIGDPRAPGWPGPAQLPFEQQTFAEFLRAQGASSAAIEVLKLGYFDLFGDGIYAVAALDVLRDLALTLEGVPPQVKPGFTLARQFGAPAAERFRLAGGGTLDAAQVAPLAFTIEGGNDRLPRALAATAALARRIEYETAVARIEDTGSAVRVTSRDGRSWEAAAAIITLPFSVLRELELRAPLSEPKRRVIRELRATSVTRTYVQTAGRPWQAMGLAGTAATDLPIMYVNDQSITQPGPAGILESYSAGPRARAWAALPPADRHAGVVAQLDQVYPGVAQSVLATTSKCWDDDEFARGDYIYFEPGEMARFLPVVARPEGRLHFAGEHTSCMPGWMQGAFESGHRAAAEVHWGG